LLLEGGIFTVRVSVGFVGLLVFVDPSGAGVVVVVVVVVVLAVVVVLILLIVGICVNALVEYGDILCIIFVN